MDNIKTLMDKKEYELVIKLTNSANDSTMLFYRITSFIALGQFDNALSCLTENKTILETRLDLLIKIHIELLCLMNKFDEARKELEHYENLPYQNQIVEEVLRSMPKYIVDEEIAAKNVNKRPSLDELYELLESEDDDNVLFALSSLDEYDISNFIESIKNILLNYKNQLIRSYALLLLVKKEYSRSVKFNSNGNVTELVPSSLNQPFDNDFENYIKELTVNFNNTTLSDIAITLYSRLVLSVFPNKIDFSKDDITDALSFVSNKMLDPNYESDANQYNENVKKLIRIIEEIEKAS